MSLQVRDVLTARDLRQFLKLPREIYPPTSRYVQPLDVHLKMMMGSLKAPKKHFVMAYDGDKPVARLGAKVHEHGAKTHLHFGFFECIEGYEDAARLMVESLHKRYPQLPMMGPFHFRMEDPYVGLLVDGYERDPYFLMPYNPPYYLPYLEKAGLHKTMDLFTYEVVDGTLIGKSEVILENTQKARNKGIQVRPLDKRKLKSEARMIAEIFNDALSKNWGYEEFLEDQIKEMVTLFRLFIDPKVVAIATHNDKAVGCLIMIPDFNPIIKASKGKITPGLIWKFFTKKRRLSKVRGYALGVKKEYHGYGIGSLLSHYMFENIPNHGYSKGEISWILSNNGPMNELSKAMGAQHNKVYRILEKAPLNN